MKRVIASLSSAAASALFLATKASAALPQPPDIPGLAGGTDLKAIIVNLVKTVLDFILLIAVVFVIVAGIRLIVSSGDEGEKDAAKKTIIYVVAGIIIIILARVLVGFVSTLI